MSPKCTFLALAATFLLGAAAIVAADQTPLGHRDFYPSPDRPVGFRGDGSGYFPGATPVTEWAESAPKAVEREYTDRNRKRTGTAWLFTEGASKNIVWKTEMPAWVNGQPIVVGDRVFTMGEPDMLICVDANSGKVLWSRSVSPWHAADLPRDKADKARELYQAYLAVDLFNGLQFHFGTCGRYLDIEKYGPIMDIFIRQELPNILKRLKQVDPEGNYEGPAKQMVEALEVYRANPLDGKGCWKYGKQVKQLTDAIARRIEKITGMKAPLEVPWGNMVGWCMSSPVSDGKYVYASMGQGQTVCFDLNGDLVWARYFEQGKVSTHHVLSPLLAGDVFVDMHGNDVLRGLDKQTGEAKWECRTAAATKSKKGGYYVASHKVVTLGGEPYIVTSQCNIIRAGDGKSVGELPYGEKYGGGAPITGHGDIVVKCANGDGWSDKFRAFKLTREAPDKVTAKMLWEFSRGSYDARPTTAGAFFMCSRDASTVDLATGKVLNKSRDFGGDFRLIAGNVLIATDGGQRDVLGSMWSRRRFDGKVAHVFNTHDVSDAANPKTLSAKNVLGGDNQPRLPDVEKYTPNLWKHPDYYNAKGGRPAHFAHTDTCIFPSGNRLFLRSVSHLYCIGDPEQPYDWNPKSRPEPIAARLR